MKKEIKNLKKTALRLKKAALNDENIILYGDSDLDGVTSVIIAKEALQNLGAKNVSVYFPDRENEGYGINEKSLQVLKERLPAVLVALDCGIGNIRESKIAQDMGFEVIIVDHHEILDKMPSASIIVDPKQKGDNYPFKYFAAAGLSFKLAKELLGEKMTESLRRNFLELACMATIADMMPREDENEKIIEEGLVYLKESWRPGIRALLDLDDLRNLDIQNKVYRINSILNIRPSGESKPAPFIILTVSSEQEARELAERFFQESFRKRERIKEMASEVEIRISRQPSSPFIFEGSSVWELPFLGVVASIISNKYGKAVFLIKKGDEESNGGIRAPSGINAVEAMKSCSQYIGTFGGHPQAAGFRIKNENIENFKECLEEYFSRL